MEVPLLFIPQVVSRWSCLLWVPQLELVEMQLEVGGQQAPQTLPEPLTAASSLLASCLTFRWDLWQVEQVLVPVATNPY